MPFLRENLEWKARWEERGKAVKEVLGESIRPGEVVPFTLENRALPGACGMEFERKFAGASYLYMTLGLTQPLDANSRANPWEYAVRTKTRAQWPHELLHDLLIYWLSTNGDVARGYYVPLVFFRNPSGELSCGITNETHELDIVGSIRGLYFWDDAERLVFPISGGFRLMAGIAVTDDEDRLAQEATPPHLLLLLQRMGVGQVTDPNRRSVLALPNARHEWKEIQAMSHEEVLVELEKS